MFHSTCPRSCSRSARSSGSVTSTRAARTSWSVSTGRPAARLEAAAANIRLRAGLRVEGELGGPGPRRGRGLVPAAPAGPLGGVVERGDDVLVGSVDGGGQVPGAPVLLRGPGQGVGERPVRRTPPGAGRRRRRSPTGPAGAAGSGSPSCLGDQAGLLGDVQRVGVRAEGTRRLGRRSRRGRSRRRRRRGAASGPARGGGGTGRGTRARPLRSAAAGPAAGAARRAARRSGRGSAPGARAGCRAVTSSSSARTCGGDRRSPTLVGDQRLGRVRRRRRRRPAPAGRGCRSAASRRRGPRTAARRPRPRAGGR